MTPLVSIIIPVRNGEKTIEKCIQSLLSLNYTAFEIIVINDGSTDNTANILEKYKNIFVINTQGVGPSAARNMAVKQAKGEFVAFTDGDCIVDRQWLNELMKGYSSQLVAGVGGDQQSPEDETEFGRSIQNFMKDIGFVTGYIKQDSSSLREVEHNPTCNVMYRKEIFEKVGGFLEGLWPGEDVEFDYRIKRQGFKLLYNPRAVVYHYRVETLKKFKSMMFNYGKVQAFLLKKYGLFRAIQIVPFFAAAFLITEAILLVLNPGYVAISVLILLLPCFIYFFAKNMKPTSALRNLFYLTNTLFFWNLGFLNGMKTNTKEFLSLEGR